MSFMRTLADRVVESVAKLMIHQVVNTTTWSCVFATLLALQNVVLMSGQKNAWLWERVRRAEQHVVVMVYVNWKKGASIVRPIVVLARVHAV